MNVWVPHCNALPIALKGAGCRDWCPSSDIHDGSDKLWTVVGWVIFGLRLHPTGDTIITALDERPGHLFECRVHFADIPGSPPFDRHEANSR